MMTKKDYILIAEIIRRNTDSVNSDHIHAWQFLPDLTQALRKDNPKFDGFRFIEACKRAENHYHGKRAPAFIQHQDGRWYCIKCNQEVTDKEVELKVIKK